MHGTIIIFGGPTKFRPRTGEPVKVDGLTVGRIVKVEDQFVKPRVYVEWNDGIEIGTFQKGAL